MKHKSSYLCLTLVLVILFVSGCAMDANEKFIQGTWLFDHTKSRLEIDHLPWVDENYWTFDRGTYTNHQCCNHRNEESGRYQVRQSEGDVIILKLLDSEREELRIVIDREAGTLTIQGDRPFVRVYP